MSQETTKCISNPFLYGASKMGNIQCSCQQDVGRDFPAYFYFNDTFFDTSPKEINGNSLYIPIDFGGLTINP